MAYNVQTLSKGLKKQDFMDSPGDSARWVLLLGPFHRGQMGMCGAQVYFSEVINKLVKWQRTEINQGLLTESGHITAVLYWLL